MTSSHKLWRTMRHHCFQDARKSTISCTLYWHCYKWRLAIVGLIKVLMNCYNFLNELLPKANVLPRSTYQAKTIICPLELEVEKIHACQNDCMLFYNEDAMLEQCHICVTSRYKRNDKNIDEDDIWENKKVKRVPTKVALYFPIIPHLRRLFMNKTNAELL
jgi:hypothetical protein